MVGVIVGAKANKVLIGLWAIPYNACLCPYTVTGPSAPVYYYVRLLTPKHPPLLYVNHSTFAKGKDR